MSDTTATSSPAPNKCKPLVRVLEKRELLSYVLSFVGAGTEIVSMLVCKDMCKFVRLLRGWQEKNIEEEEEEEKKQNIVCGMSVSSVSCFLSSVRLTEWGADVLGMPMTQRTTELAVRGGYLYTLGWLLSKNMPLERNTREEIDEETNTLSFHGACNWAAENGHLSMLQYLRSLEPHCRWEEETCACAAQNGHLELLQWARAHSEPCPWNKMTCANAALKGHLEVLQWARSQPKPCPWDVWTCAYAAQNGHLDVLQWVRSQPEPCPWNEMTCANAAENGHVEVLQWARSQPEPCPWDEYTSDLSCQWGIFGEVSDEVSDEEF